MHGMWRFLVEHVGDSDFSKRMTQYYKCVTNLVNIYENIGSFAILSVQVV